MHLSDLPHEPLRAATGATYEQYVATDNEIQRVRVGRERGEVILRQIGLRERHALADLLSDSVAPFGNLREIGFLEARRRIAERPLAVDTGRGLRRGTCA